MKDSDPTNVVQSQVSLDNVGLKTLAAITSHKTLTAAAESLGIARDTLYYRIKKYGLDKYQAQLIEQARQTIAMGAVGAAEKLVDMATGKKDNLQAVVEVLDRGGVTKPKEQEAPQLHFHKHVSAEKEEFGI